MSDICKQFRVSGRVQGVYFRAFTRKTARALGLTGWVRNEDDGCVCLVACGPVEQLKQLEAALQQGSPASEVTDVQVQTVASQPFADFTIQH